MFLYKCSECGSTELDLRVNTNEEKDEIKTFKRDLLLGSRSRKVFKTVENLEPPFAYCGKCDRTWDTKLLEKEEITDASMIKFTMALMMISVMFFLAGLLLLIFSLSVGALVIASSLMLLFVTTLLYKRT